jgi:serine/threonine-protein kinase
VVHRDIKPDNVLLSHGAAMVTDFGIAKALTASRGQRPERAENARGLPVDTLTQLGTSLGTPAYMSPEQVAGDPNVDHRADLYAWGCLAYEVLTGAPPFVKDSPQRVLAAHLGETPLPLATRRADVPPALERLVLQCLAKEPGDRPASADDVLRELDSVVTPSGLSADHAALAATTGTGGGTTRRPGARSVAIALVVVAVVTLAWFATRDRSPAGGSSTTRPPDATNSSIAVLPLANLSGDKADDYFGIGLAEEMTRAISRAGVRVIGRASAGALVARGLDERAIAKELGVGSLLTGSVQRAEGQVRINVALVAAVDGSVRWSDKYDRPLTNLFAVQDEIARAVANQLLGSLGGSRPLRPTRVETSDPEAYALYLQGQVMFGRRTRQTVQQAIALFERAVARDPRFARAQASLAIAIASLPYYEHATTGRVVAPRVFAAAQKAIEVDSTVAEAWGAIAAAQMNIFENRNADANFRRAQALDTTVAVLWGWHALNLSHMGRFDEARDRVARAQAAEPASMIARTWVAQVLLAERRFAAADSATRSILAMDSTYALAWDVRGEALSHLGRHDEAIVALERNLQQLPRDRVHQTEGILAYAYARAGRAADARRVMGQLRTKNGGELPPIAVLAAAMEQLDDHAAALAMIARAVNQPDAWLQMYNRSARYDALRRDPRADSLMASIEQW